MRDILLFSHANGFPVRTYRKLFGALEDDFDIRAVERYGHDPKYPVTREWPHLVEELLDELDRATRDGTERPVWLVGHSLGGFLSLMAALRRPARVRGVVMLDSPVIAGWRAGLLRFSQIFGLDEKPGPAAVTKNRRTHWPDAEAVRHHFLSKKNFAIWDPAVLRDYAQHGTEPTGRAGERRLRFDREVEYKIYRTLPTSLGRKVSQGAPVPVGFVAGTRSREVRQCGLGATRRLVGERLRFIEGGHLYPMEKPLETAALVRDLIAQIRQESRHESQ